MPEESLFIQKDIDVEKHGSDNPFIHEYMDYVDKIVRINRDVFILSLLQEREACGYELIKKIFLKWDVLLSQGTVYPVLYSFEDEGTLRAEYGRGDMRTKIYSLTPVGRKVAQKKVEDFIKAMEYIHYRMKR
ncbi:MAG: Transcriptional regulator PadR-like family protein [Methanosaeta sp. PtaB.Bin018]|nr:hypothetical protein [Methanothrix sp.]OPX75937.1 MAG: Transcriptional regulator PadR-like family protein [Methanosaeta sp. PtaB.Bin018]